MGFTQAGVCARAHPVLRRVCAGRPRLTKQHNTLADQVPPVRMRMRDVSRVCTCTCTDPAACKFMRLRAGVCARTQRAAPNLRATVAAHTRPLNDSPAASQPTGGKGGAQGTHQPRRSAASADKPQPSGTAGTLTASACAAPTHHCHAVCVCCSPPRTAA
jgi:hypothetical protein